MVPNHVVMIANAIVLIVLGVGGYFAAETKSLTAFIGPAIGLILLALSVPTKKENSVAAHIAVVLTFVSAIAILITGIKRGNALVLIMGIATMTAFIFYVANFFIRKKMREETAGSTKS
jgi:hypothetical protein